MQVISFLHRMVDILGVHVIPHLPKALEQLLAESEVCLHTFAVCDLFHTQQDPEPGR